MIKKKKKRNLLRLLLRFFLKRKLRVFKFRNYFKKFVFKTINGKFSSSKVICYVPTSKFNRKIFYLKHTFSNFGRFSNARNKISGLWLLKKNFPKPITRCRDIFFNSINSFRPEFSTKVFLLSLEMLFYLDLNCFCKVISSLLEKEINHYTRVLAIKKKILTQNLSSQIQNVYIDSEKRFKFFYIVNSYKKRFDSITPAPVRERILIIPSFKWLSFSNSKKTKSNGFLFYKKLGQCLNTEGRLWSSYKLINKSVFFLKKEMKIDFDLFELFGFVFYKIKPDFSLVKHNIGRRASLIPKPTLGFKKQISAAVKLFIRALNRRSERSFKEKLTGELRDFILDKTPKSILMKEELIETARPLRYAVKFFFKKKKKR